MQKVVPSTLPTRRNAKNHDMSDFQAQNPENSRFLSAQKADKSLPVFGWATYLVARRYIALSTVIDLHMWHVNDTQWRKIFKI